MSEETSGPSRRQLLSMIGMLGGSTAMYLAMYELGYASPTNWKGPAKLEKAKPGASVLILGGGVAGMVAAMELRDAGYKVTVLEYQDRPGGRNMSLWGGDTVHELGGHVQNVQFDKGHYLNPGPWRIPYHHQGILHYAARCGVEMEPFMQINYNAYIHSTTGYGGKPKRYREVQADYQGHVAELLSKCTQQGALDQTVTKQDREILMQSLKEWGALDKNYAYTKNLISSGHRGYELNPGGGLTGEPIPSQPDALTDVLHGNLWGAIGQMSQHLHQYSIFQPKGGMGQIGKAFGIELGNLIQYNAKVIDIHQDDKGVTATYIDSRNGGAPRKAMADWCVCTIPASILSQIPMNVSGKMKAAINQIPYGAGLKIGLQMKRRFWEEDDRIYGGLTYTNQPSAMIGYPMWDYFSKGKGVLLGTYLMGAGAFVAAAKPPEERIKDALEYGENIHPGQYKANYECGVAVAWHRVPWTLGCSGQWTEEGRAAHYNDACALEGRIVLAGEHISRLPAWQEGAVTSATDAITRLHARVMSA